MPFAEHRPHRRPFCIQGSREFTVEPARKNMNLAITSFTVSNQDGREHFVQLNSTDESTQHLLLEVLIPSGGTAHFPFPHPLMVGRDRSLYVVDIAGTLSLSPMTIVGYVWLADDDSRDVRSLLKRIFGPWTSKSRYEDADPSSMFFVQRKSA